MARIKRLRVRQEMDIKRYKSLNWNEIGIADLYGLMSYSNLILSISTGPHETLTLALMTCIKNAYVFFFLLLDILAD